MQTQQLQQFERSRLWQVLQDNLHMIVMQAQRSLASHQRSLQVGLLGGKS
jgi:hypothetical protein